ncbi:MAG: hypothetical protein ACP6IY_13745 [Promethearchaeia archaeon]
MEPKGELSNSLQPLCYCTERDLVLGVKAYVCQVCALYSQVSKTFTEIYEESRKIAKQRIKERAEELSIALEALEEEEIDLSIDEFEEEEEDIPLKFEKRKASKDEIEEAEEFAEVECPFCGELFDDLASHIRECEFADEDVSIDDILPQRKKKRKRRKTTRAATTSAKPRAPKEGKPCPYCGKEFQRLGRHIKACKKRPENADEEKEDLYVKGEIDSL